MSAAQLNLVHLALRCPKCRECYDITDNSSKKPHQSRACTHTACLQCILETMEDHPNQKKWMPCPVCEIDKAHHSTQFFENGAIIAVIEAINGIEESTTND